MKKIALVAALSVMAVSSAFATPPVVVGAGGGVGVSSTISGNFFAANGGSAETQAMNSQSATATSTASQVPGGASFTGKVGTQSSSYAWNVSTPGATGTANGGATSTGSSGANASGNFSFGGASQGANSTDTNNGNVTIVSNDNLVVGSNQGGWTGSALGGSITGTEVSTQGPTSSGGVNGTQVNVSSTFTGDVWGATGSGNLTLSGATQPLGTPNVSSVTASGNFNGTSNLVNGEANNASFPVNGNL